ncbi:hypothetical protein N7478_003617 [Penicillium angulare]|uniref:uncharacterized protein n=1 Tax=Penicillium angulare TaxID=116970 RepID=UPI00253F7648|nr:uncharacterized protein N7478_003617 [Penicillium angulare]KAJ5287931.1 hypothetical protein N7478_003617 [Penicillium angulare]
MDQKASSLPSTQSENEVLHAIRQTILYFIQICNALLFCIIAAHWLWNRRYKGRQSEVLPSTTVACSQEDEQNAQLSAEDYHVSRISYSEDTIINIISDIYRVYLQLNYISDWEMSWAPKEGHPIKQAICEELHLDHVVVSLMKRLPYFRFSGISDDIEFIHPYSRAFVYLEESELRGGRDPDRFTFEKPRPDFLLPWEIALTCSMDEGIHLILDTKESE